MSRRVSIDCPYCDDVGSAHVSVKDIDHRLSPWRVGPWVHKCFECKQEFIWTAEVDLIVKTYRRSDVPYSEQKK